MQERAKEYYKMLKDNNDLEDVFPSATGEWDLDKESFTAYYEDTMNLVDDFEHEED